MSEYQYYEFQAIDRPLTDKEMGELRSYSTRARITPTSFVNDYSWGNFKGNADAWMDRYFDAFLYFANWGTHVLKVRLPGRLLDLNTAEEYCAGESTLARQKGGKVIVSFDAEDEGGDEWAEDEANLASLIPVRAELARGDLRALYLGWLLCMQNREIDEQELEPPIPPGLGQLSASLESLARFLRIDDDLLHVAAQASPTMEDVRPSPEEVRTWAAKLPAAEKNRIIARLVADEDPALGMELHKRFLEDKSTAAGRSRIPLHRRTVGELLEAAEVCTQERRQIEAKRQAEAQVRREQEAAIARRKYLDGLAVRESEVWAEVKGLIATTQPTRYNQAVQLLMDLRDLAQRDGKDRDFGLKLQVLREAHCRKPTLIERLRKAGL